MSESAYSFSLTTFSPSGKLVQIEHALRAVTSGATALGVKGERTKLLLVCDGQERFSIKYSLVSDCCFHHHHNHRRRLHRRRCCCCLQPRMELSLRQKRNFRRWSIRRRFAKSRSSPTTSAWCTPAWVPIRES
jgi:hypothetical protein